MSLIGIIKKPFIWIKNIFTAIYRAIKSVFALFKGVIAFIKGLIDFIYKMFFICFFGAIAFVAYKVWVGSTEIKSKLTQIEKSINGVVNAVNVLQNTSKALSGKQPEVKPIKGEDPVITQDKNKENKSENNKGIKETIKNLFK